jgi:hypothetical protein
MTQSQMIYLLRIINHHDSPSITMNQPTFLPVPVALQWTRPMCCSRCARVTRNPWPLARACVEPQGVEGCEVVGVGKYPAKDGKFNIDTYSIQYSLIKYIIIYILYRFEQKRKHAFKKHLQSKQPARTFKNEVLQTNIQYVQRELEEFTADLCVLHCSSIPVVLSILGPKSMCLLFRGRVEIRK